MATAMTTSRTYRGMTPSERSADRRERLMATGLELFGTVGYNNTSVRALSAAATLNSRYFYEAFESREDLLYNVYQCIVEEMITNVAEAVQGENNLLAQTRAGIRAGWITVTEDPRKARIIAHEVVGVSERLERLRRDTRHALAKLTADEAVALAPIGTRLSPRSYPCGAFAHRRGDRNPARLEQRRHRRFGGGDRRTLHNPLHDCGLRGHRTRYPAC